MREEIKERIEMINKGMVPQGYKKTKLGIVPKDWEVLRIKDCLERVDNAVAVDEKEEYVQIGIRSHGKGIFYKEPVTGKELGNKRVFWIEPNCFIVNIVFAWERAISKTTDDEMGMIASHRFPMYKPINDKVDVDYLVQYFLTQKGKDVMEYASPGGAGRNRTLGQERFMNSYINCPNIIEQKNIARIIICFNNFIFIQENYIQEKKQCLRYLSQNLLTGKKRLSEYNGKWENMKLSKILNEIDKRTNAHGEHEVLTSSRKGLCFQSEYFKKNVSSEDNKGYKIISKGEFTYRAMSDDGRYTFNRLNICEKGIVSPAYTVFKINSLFADSNFIYYMMNDYSFSKYLKVLQQGGTRQSLNFGKLCGIEVKVPEIDEQKAIAKILSKADEEIELLEKQLEQIKLEKKAIMQLLLSGIVRVN